MERVISGTSRNPVTLLLKYGIMTNVTCAYNCSGHGECHNGTCFCEIKFDGDLCRSPNFSYYNSFAALFFFIALVCIIQLITCIIAEYQKMKSPSFLNACHVTTQKLLYVLAFLAAIIRGVSFTTLAELPNNLVSAHYPLLLSGVSLVICFWAEIFHLPNICWEKPQFLSKSFVGFVAFNFITYSIFLAEFITKQFSTTEDQKIYYLHVFNSCYALLIFISVVFFLIYGVEVYFKIHLGFLNKHQTNDPSVSNRCPADEREASSKLVNSLKNSSVPFVEQKVDPSQLSQSRFGLVAQAVMLTVIVLFLCSETFKEIWKNKVPLYSRNWHDVTFHVAEVGVILWFPCVLWNCMSPEQLWILNPKRLLKKFDFDTTKSQDCSSKEHEDSTSQSLNNRDSSNKDCWICYDSDVKDILIQPCLCRGDVSSVHHDCLKRWIIESVNNPDSLKCKICDAPYQVEKTKDFQWCNGLTVGHWIRSIAIVAVMCTAAAGGCFVIQAFNYTVIRLLAAGCTLLTEYICIKFLSQHAIAVYQRAQVSALNIVGNQTSTSAETVALNLSKADSQMHI